MTFLLLAVLSDNRAFETDSGEGAEVEPGRVDDVVGQVSFYVADGLLLIRSLGCDDGEAATIEREVVPGEGGVVPPLNGGVEVLREKSGRQAQQGGDEKGLSLNLIRSITMILLFPVPSRCFENRANSRLTSISLVLECISKPRFR